MPKTFKYLYPQIYDFENLYRAYRKARKGGKRKKEEVAAFELDLAILPVQRQVLLCHLLPGGSFLDALVGGQRPRRCRFPILQRPRQRLRHVGGQVPLRVVGAPYRTP